jgi:oxalate decarboxylase
MSNAVLGNTYDLAAAEFAALRRDTTSPDRTDPHRFAIEAQSPPVDFACSSTSLRRAT